MIKQKQITTLIQNESGTTAVEYAVMLALIVGTCIAVIATVGGQGGNMWSNNSSEITSAMNSTAN